MAATIDFSERTRKKGIELRAKGKEVAAPPVCIFVFFCQMRLNSQITAVDLPCPAAEAKGEIKYQGHALCY
jgi:hypothetical protein